MLPSQCSPSGDIRGSSVPRRAPRSSTGSPEGEPPSFSHSATDCFLPRMLRPATRGSPRVALESRSGASTSSPTATSLPLPGSEVFARSSPIITLLADLRVLLPPDPPALLDVDLARESRSVPTARDLLSDLPLFFGAIRLIPLVRFRRCLARSSRPQGRESNHPAPAPNRSIASGSNGCGSCRGHGNDCHCPELSCDFANSIGNPVFWMASPHPFNPSETNLQPSVLPTVRSCPECRSSFPGHQFDRAQIFRPNDRDTRGIDCDSFWTRL